MQVEDIQVLVGMAVVAYGVWKLCGFILRQGTILRRVILVLAWGWLIVNIAKIASYPETTTKEDVERQVRYAFFPLTYSIREMRANRRKS